MRHDSVAAGSAEVHADILFHSYRRRMLRLSYGLVRRASCALRRILAMLVVGCALASAAQAADEAYEPQVMGWIPTYAFGIAEAALNSNPAIGEGLTRIGLQFWNPGKDGRSVVRAPVDATGTPIDEAVIERIRDWAHDRDIGVLLTVYNNSETTKVWDWELALRGFRDHRSSFITSLVSQMDKYDLDGIDIDLEGNGALDGDREAFAEFIADLSKAVHVRGKVLTVDTFHSPCYNAPNMSWWEDWKGQVDTLHIMGYQDLYEASTETFQPDGKPVCENGAHIFKYSWQMAYGLQAGYRPDQIAMGQPSFSDHWGKGAKTDVITHIHEVQALGAGIAIWDLQLPNPGWRSDATWQAAKALREHPGNGWKALAGTSAGGSSAVGQ